MATQMMSVCETQFDETQFLVADSLLCLREPQGTFDLLIYANFYLHSDQKK